MMLKLARWIIERTVPPERHRAVAITRRFRVKSPSTREPLRRGG